MYRSWRRAPVRAAADAPAGASPSGDSGGASKTAADAASLADADVPPAAPGPTGFPAHLSASGETGMPDFISVWGFTLVSVMAFCWVRDGGGYWRGAFVGAVDV